MAKEKTVDIVVHQPPGVGAHRGSAPTRLFINGTEVKGIAHLEATNIYGGPNLGVRGRLVIEFVSDISFVEPGAIG